MARQLRVGLVCCSLLRSAAVCCGLFRSVAVCWGLLRCAAICCGLLRSVAVCCRLLLVQEIRYVREMSFCVTTLTTDSSFEDRGQRERGSGGASLLVRDSTQFANEWNPYLIRLYGCIFYGTGNSAQLCQNFGNSVGGGLNPPPHPGTPLLSWVCCKLHTWFSLLDQWEFHGHWPGYVFITHSFLLEFKSAIRATLDEICTILLPFGDTR
jgi:hypothetical protein